MPIFWHHYFTNSKNCKWLKKVCANSINNNLIVQNFEVFFSSVKICFILFATLWWGDFKLEKLMLLTPRRKKLLDFLSNFNLTTKNLVVDAVPLIYLIALILPQWSLHSTMLHVFFVVNLSVVAFLVLDESFNCCNSLSWGVISSLSKHHH